MTSSPRPTAEHPTTCGTAGRRIVIVGAGIAGVSAAHRLSAFGHVTLLERESSPGIHATGRSAATLSETSGTRVMCALAVASRPALDEPPEGFANHDLTSPRGLLWIGRDDDAAALDFLAQSAASGISASTRRLDQHSVRQLIPALRTHAVSAGGVFEPDARGLDVEQLMSAYLRGARGRGVDIRLDTELVEAHRTGGHWQITTTRGLLEADTIVNASGAWGDVIARRCGVRSLGLRPLRRSACLARVPRDVSGWPLVMDVANRCYFEPEAGGVLLSPADEHPSEPVDARAEELDIALAIEMINDVTDLEVRSVVSTWAGLRTFTHDRNPAVGPDDAQGDFVWLVGQGGAGIKTAPAMADVLAATMGLDEWPPHLTKLGVSVDDLTPSRLR